MKRTDLKTAAVIILCLAALFACGKKGDPRPQDERNLFAWNDLNAEYAGDCLDFQTALSGAYENAGTFILELEAVTDELCLGCPFRATTSAEVEPAYASEGHFSFYLCPPAPADAYRWRIIAHNTYRSLPSAVSTPKLVRRPFPLANE